MDPINEHSIKPDERGGDIGQTTAQNEAMAFLEYLGVSDRVERSSTISDDPRAILQVCDTQPFPELGKLYTFQIIEPDSEDVNATEDPEWDVCPFDEQNRAAGHLFVFEEGRATIAKILPAIIENPEAAIAKLIGDHEIEAFEIDLYLEHDLVGKGHPFESLVVLEALERELMRVNNPLYAIAPGRKVFGTSYSSIYEHIEGETLEDHYPSNTYRELFGQTLTLASIFIPGKSLADYMKDPGEPPTPLEEIQYTNDILKRVMALASTLDLGEQLSDEQTAQVERYHRAFSRKDPDSLESNLKYDIRLLNIRRALIALWEDAENVEIPFESSGLCEGDIYLDIADRNIILREDLMTDPDNPRPIFSIIDQYHLGDDETRNKRKKHGGGPRLSFG